MQLVLDGTARLHKYSRPCSGGYKCKFGNISEWFIDMLRHYPRQMGKTLKNYIKAVLTDANLNADKDLQAKYLDNCAQYDSALIRICGSSVANFIERVSFSKETQHRVNCIDLLGRILVIDTKCEWEIFRDRLSPIPREIKLIRILLQKTYDQNNVVELKAINTFLKITVEGSQKCKEILAVNILLITNNDCNHRYLCLRLFINFRNALRMQRYQKNPSQFPLLMKNQRTMHLPKIIQNQ